MKKLLLLFFKNEKYPGWKNIAEKLIDTGECIVSGNECIWKGGIGNFISTKPAENAIDCSLYTFNLNSFKTSEYYKETKDNYLEELNLQKTELEKQLLQLQQEIKEIK